MKTLCELKVKNLKDATVVVAGRILLGKESRVVPFRSDSQLKGALAAEKREIIKIETPVPDSVFVKYPHLKDKPKKVEPKKPEAETVNLNVDAANEAMSERADGQDDGYKMIENEQTDPKPIIDEKQLNEGITEEAFENAKKENAKEDGLPEQSREGIIDMTLKEMKEFISSNDSVNIEKYSKMNAGELTDALLELYGYEKLSDDEK